MQTALNWRSLPVVLNFISLYQHSDRPKIEYYEISSNVWYEIIQIPLWLSHDVTNNTKYSSEKGFFFIKSSCFISDILLALFLLRDSLSLTACVCLTWQDSYGLQWEWPLAHPLGVATACWVGAASWEMEYIKGVLHNGRFLGSTVH